MLYLRRLPWGRAAWLYGAVACTFCTLGFVVDLGRVTWLTPRFTVVAMAAWSGAIACLYVIAIVHRRSLFLLAIAAQIGLVYASNRILPVGTNPHRNPPTLRAIESQATFDAIGCLAAMVAGYTLFLAFISREGLRQVDREVAGAARGDRGGAVRARPSPRPDHRRPDCPAGARALGSMRRPRDQPVARFKAARARRRVESSVGSGERASSMMSGSSVHPRITASQRSSAFRRAISRCR
jgi:hypothetical protein